MDEAKTRRIDDELEPDLSIHHEWRFNWGTLLPVIITVALGMFGSAYTAQMNLVQLTAKVDNNEKRLEEYMAHTNSYNQSLISRNEWLELKESLLREIASLRALVISSHAEERRDRLRR